MAPWRQAQKDNSYKAINTEEDKENVKDRGLDLTSRVGGHSCELQKREQGRQKCNMR